MLKVRSSRKAECQPSPASRRVLRTLKCFSTHASLSSHSISQVLSSRPDHSKHTTTVMGLKRKASVIDNAGYCLRGLTRPSAPSSTSSSFSPTSTNTLSHAHNSHDKGTYNFCQIEAVPYYLHSRTRKRHRDDRPGEEIIHEHTLRKLYDAQRLHLGEALPISELIDLDEQARVMEEGEEEDEDTDMSDEPLAELPRSPQRNQRTLEAFFGGRNTAATPSSKSDQG